MDRVYRLVKQECRDWMFVQDPVKFHCFIYLIIFYFLSKRNEGYATVCMIFEA